MGFFLLVCAFGFPCITLFGATIWVGTAASETKAKRQSNPDAKRTEVFLSGAYLAVMILNTLLSSLVAPTADLDLSQIWRTIGVTALIAGACFAPVTMGIWFVRTVMQIKKTDVDERDVMLRRKAWTFGAATLVLVSAVIGACILLQQETPL